MIDERCGDRRQRREIKEMSHSPCASQSGGYTTPMEFHLADGISPRRSRMKHISYLATGSQQPERGLTILTGCKK
jgi:hypothetical protein